MSFNADISYLKWSNILKLANEIVLRLLKVFWCAFHLLKNSEGVVHLKGHPIDTLDSPSLHASQVGVISQPFSFHIGHRSKTKPWIPREPIVLVQDPLLEKFLSRQFLLSLIILAKFSIRK